MRCVCFRRHLRRQSRNRRRIGFARGSETLGIIYRFTERQASSGYTDNARKHRLKSHRKKEGHSIATLREPCARSVSLVRGLPFACQGIGTLEVAVAASETVISMRRRDAEVRHRTTVLLNWRNLATMSMLRAPSSPSVSTRNQRFISARFYVSCHRHAKIYFLTPG